MPTIVNGDEQTLPVRVTLGAVVLEGDLTIPTGTQGLVLFAHGSGSSRFSPRNRHVAGVLHGGSLATLLLDLLTPQEEEIDLRTRQFRFDIALLAQRLVGAVDWLAGNASTRHLRIGCFGSSTGAAAALIAAAECPRAIAAVVSRGGRTDLAGAALAKVRAPTLLIVGGEDTLVLELNRQSLVQLNAPKELTVIPGATHLFEEPGALDQVAALARSWFQRHLRVPSQ